MRRRVRLFLWLLISAAGVSSTVAARPQGEGALPPAATIVKPHGYVSLEPVPRGQKFEIAVVAEIRNGFHMNSNHPTDEFLIPTTLTIRLPQGMKQIEVVYPAGELKKFSFSDKPLSVYSGKVTLLVKMEAGTDAPLGAQTILMTLGYQACNDNACLPPVKIPVEVKLHIVSAGTHTRPANPEIFSSKNSERKK